MLKAVKLKGSKALDADDLAYVKAAVAREATKRGLQQPSAARPRRFAPLDRVVCRVARGDRLWAAGSVQALDQENDAIDPYATFPYVVKVDPPDSFGFSCPGDTDACVRAEVCFGNSADALEWTLRCLPRAMARGSRQGARRFRVGERVACAVEAAHPPSARVARVEASEEGYTLVEAESEGCTDCEAENGGYTDWAAGTVSTVDHAVEGVGGLSGGVVPYRVAMDGGGSVLVHRDEHWLVRDLQLQPAGPRVAPDGTRAVTRMGKRKLGDDTWQMVDHMTRNVRKLTQETDDDG